MSEVQRALQELLSLDGRPWVVSCYQKLEPADRQAEKFRIKLKNRLRRAGERVAVLGHGRAEREEILAALERIEHFFQFPSNLEGARGVAVFAAPGLFRVVRLPLVLRSRVVIDRSPVVGELVALAETGTRLLAVVADRTSARLFDVGLDAVEELEGLVAPDATRAGKFHANRKSVPGVGEYRFHNRIREEKQRHLARVAEAALRAFRVRAFDGVVVGGIGVDASALLPHLDASLRDKVVGVLKLAPKKATPAEIREQALQLLAEVSDVQAAEAVAEAEALLPSGWATSGIEPTLRALHQGAVRVLIVDHDATVPGYRLSQSGRLTTSPVASRGEGEPVAVADVLDDAIEEALRQRARVLVVRGAMARRIERLAGLLRFRAGR
ncbi:MAG TPA: hypothetical protein VNL98_07340 [Gemmatimonadales bacterium]|nr:hypothetical protein [Gemmatimonadales bacterium]